MHPETDEQDQLFRMRHSASHVLAEAVLALYPNAKLGIGPAIENGFYYDFLLDEPLTPEDLERIEGKMKQLLKQHHLFQVREIDPEEGRRMFASQPFKLEILEDILRRGTDEYGEALPEGERPKLTVYTHSGFTDLCRGPHVADTGEISASGLKLLNTSAAYWGHRRGASKSYANGESKGFLRLRAPLGGATGVPSS